MVDDSSVCGCSQAVSVKPNNTLIFVINVAVSPTPNDDVPEVISQRAESCLFCRDLRSASVNLYFSQRLCMAC